MSTRYLDEDPEDVKGDIFKGLQNQLNMIAVKKQAEQLRKQQQADKIRQAIIESATSGKMKPKEGATFGDIPDTENVGELLGYLGKNLEPVTNKYKARVTRTQRPFSEILGAREELARTPEDWAKAGMGTETVTPAPGILGKTMPGIFNKKSYQVSPEAEKIQSMARGIINDPYKESISMSGVDIEGEGEMDEDLKALIEEYQTTDDPVRLKEIEDELTQRGVNFQ